MKNLLLISTITTESFIPQRITTGKKDGKTYPLSCYDDGIYYCLSYNVDLHNQFGLVGTRSYSYTIPKYIPRNNDTFEAIGLLEAEMGKRDYGKISFSNHEYKLINKVINWFSKQLELPKKKWRWYIKVNINVPEQKEYKTEVEEKVIRYWISQTGLSFEQGYPKKVSYVKSTINKRLGFYDYGTLIIEYKNNLFSQIIKKMVKDMSGNILDYNNLEIKNFLRGIIAGEGCVEIHLPSKRYRVRITAIDNNFRKLIMICLWRLKIKSTNSLANMTVIISKKENHMKLLKEKLMTLSPEKYNKFLRIFKLYQDFEELNKWRANLSHPYNKLPKEKINRIIALHNEHPDWPAWKIANLVGVSAIKVQRVRKEHNLGMQKTKTTKAEFAQIIRLHIENQNFTNRKIGLILGLHERKIGRAIEKYEKIGNTESWQKI